MRYLTIFTIATLVLASCGSGQEEATQLPEDLNGLKTILAEKKKEQKTIADEIAYIEAKIDELQPNREKKRTLVTTAPIERKDFAHFVEIQATVQSDNTFQASSEVPGRLMRFTLEEGDFVKKGQLIGEVDMESMDKQIAELEKSLELANITFERQERLWKQNIGSEMQFLQAKNNKERLEKSLETIRFQKTKAKIYAPATGQINRTFVKAGDVVGAGMPLVEILNLGRVKIEADVPENYLQNVKKGDFVTIKIPAIDKELQARVTLIGQTIDPNNRTFKVEVSINNPNGQLKPNLLATMLIKDFEQKNAVVLSSELIQQEVSGRSFVFTQANDKEDGTIASKVFVTLGETYDGETLITEGLTGDETLIIKGARTIKNGELIQVSNPEKTASAQ